MKRREFLCCTTAAFFTALLTDAGPANGFKLSFNPWDAPAGKASAARPWRAVTAAVDVLVPPDPEIPGDFKGSDYGADRVLARVLGTAGQAALTMLLNGYSRAAAGRRFTACTADEQLSAIRQWVRERDAQQPLVRDLLTALLSLSMIGTFEENTADEQAKLFASMGWYDPRDPAGTFRLPNEGYVDSYLFPVYLKKGLR